MKLVDWLDQLPMEEWPAAWWESAGVGHNQRRMQEQGDPGTLRRLLIEVLTSQGYIERIVRRCKPWELESIREMSRVQGLQPFQLESLDIRHAKVGKAHIRAALLRLLRSGCILPWRRNWGETVYFWPEETWMIWQSLLFPLDDRIMVRENVESASFYSMDDEPTGLILDDLIRAAACLSRFPLRLTKKGGHLKADLRRLEAVLPDRSKAFEASGLILQQPLDCRLYTAVILELGQLVGVFARDASMKRWVLVRDHLENWLSLSRFEGSLRLRQAWDLYLLGDASLHTHAGSLLQRLSGAGWVAWSNLFEWLREYGMINEIPPEQAMFAGSGWLKPYQAFGWLDTQETKDDTWIRIREGGEANDLDAAFRFYIQGDYSIVVPPEPPLRVLWELEGIAECLRREETSEYRLTAHSLQQAGQAGRSTHFVLDFLRTYAFGSIPTHIVTAVQDWMKQGHTQSGLGDPVDWIEESSEQKDLVSEDRGLFLRKRSKPPGHPDPTLGGMALPDEWRRIPSIWWKELRSYHASTEMELLQTSMEWGTSVLIRTTDGHTLELLPSEIKQEDGVCILSGRNDGSWVQVQSDNWCALQLVLPGMTEASPTKAR